MEPYHTVRTGHTSRLPLCLGKVSSCGRLDSGGGRRGPWMVRSVLLNCTARPPHLKDAQATPVRRAGPQHRGHARPPCSLSQPWTLRSATWKGCWVRGVERKPRGTDVGMIRLQWPWAMDCESLVPALWASQAPQGPPSSLKTLPVVTGPSPTPAPLQDLKREKWYRKKPSLKGRLPQE